MSPQLTRISRYEIKGLIAEGGMGELYLARDPNTDRIVALKLLNATVDSEDLRERFEREAQALAALSHPNIVHIYDYGDFQNAPFIVMEYVRGETLSEQIKRQAPLSIGQKLKLLVELCSGLDHAHGADIVHRDVKPANLMVDLEGRLRILDFGIARFAESSMTQVAFPGASAHVQIGTPGYMSPEQMAGGQIDRRADVFAVGAVCYELLSGREAFPGANSREIHKKIAAGLPPPLSSFVADIEPEIDAIVARALDKEPGARFQDTRSLGEALERQRVRVESSEPIRPRATPPPLASGRRSPAMRADAAYQRASALYKEGSLEAARRFALEALAEDSEHAGAHALMARLARDRRPASGPLVVQPATSTVNAPATAMRPVSPVRTASRPPTAASPVAPTSDETVLIRPPAKTQVSAEETLMIPRAVAPVAPVAPAPRPPAPYVPPRRIAPDLESDETILIPRSAAVSKAPAVLPPPLPRDLSSLIPDDQTVLIPRSSPVVRTSSAAPPLGPPVAPPASRPPASPAPAPASVATKPPSSRAAGASKSSAKRSARSGGGMQTAVARAKTLWSKYGRTGQVIAGVFAVGTIAVAAILLTGSWSSGNRLRITKPTGGTISANGIRCGTLGAECSASFAEGDLVELQVQADAGYVFEGYQGDCAPSGRIEMSAERTCGAMFSAVPEGPKGGTEWPLTIERPTGGSILSVGITCGTLGSQCSSSVLNGMPVTLHTKADPGWTFLKFSDGCGPTGDFTMTSARTCSASFVQAVASASPADKSAAPLVTSRRAGEPGGLTGLVGGAGGGSASAPVSAGRPPTDASSPEAAAQSSAASGGAGATAAPGAGAAPRGGGRADSAPPITEEQHAKNSILGILKGYCTALQDMNLEKVHELYQRESVASLRSKYNSYKSNKCSLVGDPDYKVLDVPGGAATVEIGMKQVLEKKVGGAAPEVSETIATVTFSRPQALTDWRILTMNHRKKPKE